MSIKDLAVQSINQDILKTNRGNPTRRVSLLKMRSDANYFFLRFLKAVGLEIKNKKSSKAQTQLLRLILPNKEINIPLFVRCAVNCAGLSERALLQKAEEPDLLIGTTRVLEKTIFQEIIDENESQLLLREKEKQEESLELIFELLENK